MKKKFSYALLFAIPGLGLAMVGAFFVFGTAAGFFWLTLFGDNPWPLPAEKILSGLFVLVFCSLWCGLVAWGYHFGNKREDGTPLNRKHVWLSAGATAALLLLIILQQFSVGNLGPRSDSLICSDFCKEKGFSASGLPPRDSGQRICSCYDRNGQVTVTVDMEEIMTEKSD